MKNLLFSPHLILLLVIICHLLAILTLILTHSIRNKRRQQRLFGDDQTLEKKNLTQTDIHLAQLQGQAIERKRIGYELHNNVGGSMYGLRLLLRRIQPASLPLAEQEVYRALTNSLKQTHETIRLISHNLMPGQLSQQGLSATLTQLIADLNQLETTNFEIRLFGSIDTIPDPIQFELYTILLELTQNVLRHAEAESASVQVMATTTNVQLQVRDDGRGIEPSRMAGNGLGLRTVRERVETMNGSFQLETLPEGGIRFLVSLPFESGNAVSVSKIDQTHRRPYPNFTHEVASVGFNGVFTNE